MRTLSDLGDLEGKRVLVRVDFNVPLADGAVTDDTRIRGALPTIRELQTRGAALVLVSHLGRPKGLDPSLSLRPVATRLSELLGREVTLAPPGVGADVAALAAALGPAEVLLLENIRFEPGETTNDDALADALAGLADVYVDDAFGAAHRAHASTEGVARRMPERAAGLLLEREVTTLTRLLNEPARPMVAVLGGAKVSDKLGVIQSFLAVADTLLIGGAMCFPFLAASGPRRRGLTVRRRGRDPGPRADRGLPGRPCLAGAAVRSRAGRPLRRRRGPGAAGRRRGARRDDGPGHRTRAPRPPTGRSS